MGFQKIGVFAGAFDPMHNGHIKFIDDSILKYNLDRVFILIEEKSKFKNIFAELAHRKKIIELSIKNKSKIETYKPRTPNFPISSTLPDIKIKFKDAKFYLLIGSDVREHIPKWPGASELLRDIELVVAERNNSNKYRQISSGKVREQIKAGLLEADMQKDALIYCRQNKLYG